MDVKNDLSGGKPTLLIAEDEESNYLLLKTILHKYCNLIRAKTGLEALALFKENEVDLILMDIKMPEMTGIESLKEIRKLSKDIPVIMMRKTMRMRTIRRKRRRMRIRLQGLNSTFKKQ